jgi:hypothetical protein
MDNEKFLTQLRSSPIGEKLVADTEFERLSRRREAQKKWNTLAKSESKFQKELEAGRAELAERRETYESAEQALREAGAALFMAQRSVEALCKARDDEEAAARGAVAIESNPRRFELLFNPIRRAIDAARAERIVSESERSNKIFAGGSITKRLSSRPSILSRIAFLERALNHANDLISSIDDDDETLAKIREAIFTTAPAVDRLVEIPLTHGGDRITDEREISSAIAKADELAKAGFNLSMKGQP